jgi:hypothetical protein
MDNQRIKQIEDEKLRYRQEAERLIHKAELVENVDDASLALDLEEIKVITADTHTLVSQMIFLVNQNAETNEKILSVLERVSRKIGA